MGLSGPRLSAALFAATCLVACGDSSAPTPRDDDAGVDDAGSDAGAPTTCCADEACTKVTPGACAAGELCALDQGGANGACTDACPETQVCGSLCCPWGAACDDGVCALSDLEVTVSPTGWPYPTSTGVPEDACLAQDACVAKPGRYSLLEAGVRVKNVGKVPFHLKGVADHAGMDVSFCQGSYLMRDFIHATIKDDQGKVARETDLPTLCRAEGDDYLCGVAELAPGKTVDLPEGDCNQLDVTGLAKGTYTVELEVNAQNTIAERRHDNNVATFTFAHSGCDGFACGGECCPPDVACVDGVCARPDLTVSEHALRESLFYTGRNVAGDTCTGEDRCTTALGSRRLLAFETRISNVGAAAVVTGEDDPLATPGCQGERLTRELVRYRLLDAHGEEVVGHTRDLCLTGMSTVDDPGPTDPNTAPWPDVECGRLDVNASLVYGSGVSCQWLDVTDVAPGAYTLEVVVNPAHAISDANPDNDVVRIPVTVPSATCEDVEVCGDDVDQDCDNLPDAYDTDCGGPGPEPGGYTATTGNTSCDAAHAIEGQGWLETALPAGTSEALCEAQGSAAFYALTVAADEIVYLDVLDSDGATSLIVHGETCGSAPVACSAASCGRESGSLARLFTPGRYVVEARTRAAGTANTARLRIERMKAGPALITAPGVFEGDTGAASAATIPECVGWNPDTGEEARFSVAGPHARYAVAHCETTLTASTCGTADFASAGAMFGSESEASWVCSAIYDQCAADPQGFAVSTQVDRGLDLVVVGSQSEGQGGAYQLQLSF